MVDEFLNFHPGIYEHYKSTPENRRYYQVLGIAQNTENEELYVLYVPLYVVPENTGPIFKCRPMAMFFENITVDGIPKNRFTYIGQSL